MQCPTCDEYGDLLRATVRKTGQQVIVCSECDFVWPHPGQPFDCARATDVASLLAQSGLDDDWDELELGARLAAPAAFPVVLRKYK